MYKDILRAKTPQEKSAIIKRLEALWQNNPQLRLGQLIGNVYPCGRACNTCFQDTHHGDPYHVEDFDFIGKMETVYRDIDKLPVKLDSIQPPEDTQTAKIGGAK